VAALCALFAEVRPGAKIILGAPTGRAQARLSEALKAEIETFACRPEVKQSLRKLTATTIHRLLGYRPGAENYHYHDGHKLTADLVVVDEASMVPLALMARLLSALPETAAIVLLGDQGQLASVEAGAVLADLCRYFAVNRFSPDFLAQLASSIPALNTFATRDPATADRVIELQRSYRFQPGQGIASLKELISSPQAVAGAQIAALCAADASGEIGLLELPTETAALNRFMIDKLARQTVDIEGCGEVLVASYLEAVEVADAYAVLQRFRILCAVRRGHCGVEKLNRLVPRAWGLDDRESYFRGRPLLVTSNAPHLELYNGDLGLVWPDSRDRMQVWFPRPDGDFEPFSPARLPAHETAFAMTVHKAQGSGFQRVALLWPEYDLPVLSRELFYTAVTRAARRIEIWLPGEDGLQRLEMAANRRVERPSGLVEALAALS